ncbi:MAG: tetratricopeptide repeat protein, partial [Terriglobia bacterium]
EYWYPVRGLDGGFVEATKQMAINAKFRNGDHDQPQVELIASPVVGLEDAALVVKLGSKLLREFHHINFEPLKPASFTVPVPSLGEARKELNIQIQSAQGQVLLRWSAAEPIDGNPDFVPAAGTHLNRTSYTAQTPVQELYLHGLFLQKRGNLQEALKVYDQALDRDPGYIPALLEEAWYHYSAADFEKAQSLIARALERDGENPSVKYAEGVIDRAAGRFTLAQNAFWACIHYGGPPAPAFVELGEIAIHQRDYAGAVRLLQRAVSYNPGDALALADLAAAERLAGDAREAARTSAEAVQRMPLLPYALAEQWMDDRDAAPANGSTTSGKENWAKVIGIDPQNYMAVGAWYHHLGAYASSDAVLHAAAENLPAQKLSPLIYYYLASNAGQEGKTQQGRDAQQKAVSLPCAEVFPNRVSDAAVLEEAILHNPGDAHAQYALGNFLFAHGRYVEASSLWSTALAEGFNDPVLLRNLGLYAWRVKRDLFSAAGLYARAIRLSPNDYRLYSDLDEIDEQKGDASARAKLFQSAPHEVLEQDTVRTRYALFLMEQSKFDQALAVLMNHQFKPWEGGEEVHDIFVVANVEKGKQALANHRLGEAENAFRKAMEYPSNLGVGKPSKPDDEEPLFWLGMTLQAEGKQAEAQAAWRSAAERGRNADNATAVYSALAFEKLGQKDEAQKILDRCINSSARADARAYNYFVAALAERYTHKAEMAGTDFRHAIELDPSFWRARLALNEVNRSSQVMP